MLREGSEVKAPLTPPPPSVEHSATSTHGGGPARSWTRADEDARGATRRSGKRSGKNLGSESALQRFSVSSSDLPATRFALKHGSIERAGEAEASLVTSLGTFCFAALGRIDLCVQEKKIKKDKIVYEVTTQALD